jgi:IS5 family transposase
VALAAPRAAQPLGSSRQDGLVASCAGLSQYCGPPGGGNTGPNLTDRGQSGTKCHLVVERQGILLAARISGANVHDSKMFEEMLDAIEPIRRPRGRPRKRPEKLHADKGYDYPRCRQARRRRRIKGRIARRGVDSSERLGRHRWVAERTLSWLSRYCRLKVRYERRDDIHQAFLDLACAPICWRFIERFC